MTALVTADLHWSNNRVNSYRHKFVDTLVGMLRKFKCELLLILGDLCEQKDEHPSELVNQVVGHIWRLAQVCPVVILKGNHDYVTANSPFFQFVDHIDNVRWINEPTNLQSDNFLALYLPHTHNYERDWPISLLHSTGDFIFCHQTFEGARGESGYELDGIPVTVFPKDVRVISGDVHEPQTFDVITYVGPPYRINFGDKYKPRVILIENGKTRSILCPGPKKQLIEADIGHVLSDNARAIMQQLNKGDILKIRARMPQFDPDRWAKFKDQAYSWAVKHGYELYQIAPVVEREARAMKRKNYRVVPDKEIVADYGRKRQIADAVLKTGLDFI